MNIVFWFLVILALFLIWWGARGLFDKIGRKAYDMHDELADVVTEEDVLPEYEEYDAEYAKEEFTKYMNEGGLKE